MKHLSLLIMTALLGLVTLSSCQNEENTPKQTQEAKFIYASQVENAFQLTPLADLAEGVQTTFDNSQTLPVGHLFLEKHGDYIYAMSGSMYGYGGEQTLRKYQMKDGKLQEVATLSFKGSPNVIEIIFASDTKAYGVTCASRGQLVIFNPSTMQEMGEIDLSPYAATDPKAEAPDKDPDAGTGIVRDGKLFLCLNQTKSMMELYDEPASVAVIDVATDKVEKVIKDARVQSLGMVGHTNAILDEAGNIYFYSGPRSAMFGKPEGILRIKKGETDFDKEYYVSVTKADGAEPTSYGMTMTYYKGKVYFFLEKPSLVVDPNDKTFTKNKDFVPYELDLKSGKGKILPLPGSSGWSANATIAYNGKIYFGIHAKDGLGFYSYDPATGQGSNKPVVTTPAGIYKIIKL